jgi:Phage derived protein Gp49-like (DUF891)
MPTERIYKGAKFEIKSWVEGDSIIVSDFLEELAENGDSDAERLYNLMIRTADNGVTKNIRQIRPLGNDIYEFKAPNTGRIMFFYDKNKLIICAHGFTGKKGSEDKFIKRQINKAVAVKEDYFREKGE